jgi:hypothetical protein
MEAVAPVASYVTVNVSSPNTPGLRSMQQASVLDGLLARVVEARERVTAQAGPTPVLLKIAPDVTLSELDDIVGVARARKIDDGRIPRTPTPNERSHSLQRSPRGVCVFWTPSPLGPGLLLPLCHSSPWCWCFVACRLGENAASYELCCAAAGCFCCKWQANLNEIFKGSCLNQ